jgi:hypothetical protein
MKSESNKRDILRREDLMGKEGSAVCPRAKAGSADEGDRLFHQAIHPKSMAFRLHFDG